MTNPDYSYAALVRFLEYAASKGILNQATARTRRVAVNKVLSLADDTEKADLRTLNMEDVYVRFVNLNKTYFKPESLSIYKSRCMSALSDFLKWVESPSTFRTDTRPRQQRILSQSQPDNQGDALQGRDPSNFLSNYAGSPRGADAINFQVSLNNQSVLVQISNIPLDLKRGEAARIKSVILSSLGMLDAIAREDEVTE